MNEPCDRILRLDEDVVQRAAIKEILQKFYEELRTAEEREREIGVEGPKRYQALQISRGHLQLAERATRATESEAAAAVNKISERRDRLKRTTDELENLTRNMGDIEACRSSLSRCDSRIDQLRTRKAECDHEVTRVGEAQDKRRLLTDQLMLIENRRMLASSEKEVEELSVLENEKREMEQKR
ncbi:hypothetical protein PENTCL1PPCAC_3397 [Pristionchus entomophagus]|uniref:Uncharacterized protein n=1 Tax=Pristionchus entomophagus TaxID=358040 RepID=A0AAV5SKL6_9BILA|nr:hypothetical protein PENTCL1PPCAC_3397 [Pristionchus entomophagus]